MHKSLTTLIVLLLWPVTVTAQPWRVSDGKLLGPSCTDEAGCEAAALPCTPTSVAAVDTTLYVACGDGGLLVVDGSTEPVRPLEVRRMLEPVAATGVRLVDGVVWVDTALGSRPLEAFDRTAPPVLQPPPPDETIASSKPAPQPQPDLEPPPAQVGHVVALGTGWVTVDVGSDHGLVEEGFVEFLRVESVDLGEGQVVQRERRVGLGQVDTLNEGRARVQLGLNERIPLGAVVRPNPEGVTSRKLLMTPPRPHGVWEAEVNVRPFLALSTLGGGAIVDGRVGRRFSAPVAVDAFFAPFGFGVARDGDILTFAGNVVVSYDTTAFQIGLGAGASRINTLPVGGTDFIEGDEAVEPSFRASFSAAQFVRLGSVDGLHVEVLNNFSLFEDEFVFGGITVSGQIPIRLFRDLAWVIGRGGGGVPGHLFGELGIRVLARGNGGPGSVFLTPTVGAGLLTGERWEACEGLYYDAGDDLIDRPNPTIQSGICRNEYDYGGPLVGFGAEWRF